jgi:hypothetical protein
MDTESELDGLGNIRTVALGVAQPPRTAAMVEDDLLHTVQEISTKKTAARATVSPPLLDDCLGVLYV